MIVQRLDSAKWSDLSEEAHLLCFNEKRDTSMDRIDFALLTTDGEKPLAYMTCKELDAETVYLQYGGSFPETQGTANSFRAYNQMLFRQKSLVTKELVHTSRIPISRC
jgi:hypothetical protein